MITDHIFRKSRRTHRLILLAFFVLLSGSLSSQPQNWNIRYYTAEDGLSSNHINCIIKDSRGMIWVGADNGLNRFDGYTFTQLEYAPGQRHLVSTIKVLSIHEDNDSLLWIGTSDGLFRYDPVEPLDSIRQFRYRERGEEHVMQQPQPVNRISEDRNGLLWMNCVDVDEGMLTGLMTFDKTTEKYTRKRISGSTDENGRDNGAEEIIVDTYCDREGTVWVATAAGLSKYIYEEDAFVNYVPYPGNSKPRINLVLYLYEDTYGNLWTPGIYGLRAFDRKTEQFTDPVTLQEYDGMIGMQSAAYSIREDRDGYLWMRVNTMDLSRFRVEPGEEGKLVLRDRWLPHLPNVTTNDQLNALLVENPYSVWLPVSDRGLCHINLPRSNFRTIEPFCQSSDVLDENYVIGLHADSIHTLWISTMSLGTLRYNMHSGRAEDHAIMEHDMVNAIDTDSAGNLWFAMKYGIHAKAGKTGDGGLVFTTYFPDTSRSDSPTRRREFELYGLGAFSHLMYEHLLHKDRSGRLWFNSEKGIHDRYDPATDGFIHLDHRKIDHYNNDTLLAEKQGEIWFPTRKGLLRVVPPFSRVSSHTFVPEHTLLYTGIREDSSSLNSDWIKAVCFSKYHEPGTMWLATIGGGLNKMVKAPVRGSDAVEIRFEHFTESDGLCNNNILGILEDRSGYLWLSTMNGLSRFDPRTESFINFYKNDGLPDNQFSWADPCTGPSGGMIFASPYGVVAFHPDSMQINMDVPRVIITSLMINNTPVVPGKDAPFNRDIRYVDEMELDYNENFLSFGFAALNYEDPERNQFRYTLEGLDRDWIHSGTRRYAEYTDLRPGRYTFRVTGSNNSGVWNPVGTSLEITIRRPPWYSWWAFTVYGLILAGLILWARAMILNRAMTRRAMEVGRLEKEKVVELDRAKSRFFANISHEFRTPLTLIMGHIDDLEGQSGDEVRVKRPVLAVLRRNARRVLLLINQLLDVSKLENHALQPELIKGDFSAWIRVLVSSFQSLADSRGIQFSSQIDDHGSPVCFDPDKTEKIVTNLLSNAFKFTSEGGMVTFCFQFVGGQEEGIEYAEIGISDTGRGMEKEQLSKIFDRFYQVESSDTRDAEGTGIGLSLVKELVELLQGTIDVQSEPGKGSRFTVILPVSEACFPGQQIRESGAAGVPFALEPDEEPGDDDAFSPEELDHDKVILVVEDNPDLRKYIGEQLSDEYRMLEAQNGQAGLELARKHLPDLVITDLMMPVMDGTAMTRQMKSDPLTNHIPVIMLTAKADKQSKLEGLGTGADDYIVKPFDRDELRARVSNLVRQRERLRENFAMNFFGGKDRKDASAQYSMLKDIMEVFDRNLSDPEFSMSDLAEALHLTRSYLFRKVGSITGTTPNELLRMVRMKRAAHLLRNTRKNVSEIMYEVGMKNPSHFAVSFKKYFGVNPAEYRRPPSS